MRVLIPDLQEEEALRRLLDQLIRDILGVKLGPELDQQRVVSLHVLSRHLGIGIPRSRGMPEKKKDVLISLNGDGGSTAEEPRA